MYEPGGASRATVNWPVRVFFASMLHDVTALPLKSDAGSALTAAMQSLVAAVYPEPERIIVAPGLPLFGVRIKVVYWMAVVLVGGLGRIEA
jgi:hypothetical protein